MFMKEKRLKVLLDSRQRFAMLMLFYLNATMLMVSNTNNYQGSRKRLKVVGAQNQIPLICGEIFEFSRVLIVLCECKTALLKNSMGAAAPTAPTLTRPLNNAT